MKKSF